MSYHIRSKFCPVCNLLVRNLSCTIEVVYCVLKKSELVKMRKKRAVTKHNCKCH